MRLSVTSSAILFSIAVAAARGVAFEDVDTVAARSSWFERELAERGAASNPGSSSTTTTTTTTTGTNSAGFPTGTTSNNSPCSHSKDCASGNCFRSKCADPSPAGSYGCYKDQGCSTGHCVNSKCVPKDGTGQNGDACNMSQQCTGGSFCNRSKCDTQKANGSSCYKANGCSSGNCVKGTCIANKSVNKGGKCNKSGQCTDGNFCNHGKCAKLRNHGSSCYKDQGCSSGYCRRGHCV